MKRVKYRRFGLLDEQHAISLLFFVDENEEVNATDLRDVSGSYYSINALAQLMAAEGFLEMDVVEDPRKVITYRITPKGKRIAAKLKEIEGIVEG